MQTASTAERPLTKPQVRMLTEAMRDCVNPNRQSVRTASRLLEQGLLRGTSGGTCYVTAAGLRALRDYRAKRWANYGCMAYLADLKEVEAAVAIA